MAFEHEKTHARRLLEGIEHGSMTASQSYSLLRDADPALVYFIFTWLRERYHAGHPAAEGVLGRLAELCSKHPAIARRAKSGRSDAIVAWFEDAHSYRDFGSHEFVDLIVEKLEG